MLIDPYRLTPIPPVNITDHTISSADNAQSTAGVKLTSAGVLQTIDTGTNSHTPVFHTVAGEWRTTAGSYDARITVVSGTGPSNGAAGSSDIPGSWLSLGSDRTWWISRSVSSPFTDGGVWTLEIRDSSTLTVLDSCTLTVNCIGTT